MELLIVVLLTILNGVLAMAEISVVSARKIRLQQLADDGNRRARRALELANEPNRFLSTVQIGITLVGVLMGAFAGTTVAEELGATLHQLIPALSTATADTIAFALVVGFTTYLSLVIGELVPKRLGLQNPERFAMMVAPAMHGLSVISVPVVRLLSASTDLILRLLRVRQSDEPSITEEEIRGLMAQGVETGVFEKVEHEMVEGVFELGDLRLTSIMTPRTEIEWLDPDEPPEITIRKVIASQHSAFPVARDSLDEVTGIVRAKDLLNASLKGQTFDLNACLQEPLFIPESATAARALELFKQTGKHLALMVGEHGGIEGLITLEDVIEEVVGAIVEPGATRREDGSWLLDGLLPVNDVKELLDIEELPGEDDGHYQTLGGFIMTRLGRVPNTADHFEWGGLRFEVIDMDGKRVDKVLVSRSDGGGKVTPI